MSNEIISNETKLYDRVIPEGFCCWKYKVEVESEIVNKQEYVVAEGICIAPNIVEAMARITNSYEYNGESGYAKIDNIELSKMLDDECSDGVIECSHIKEE